MRQEFHALIEHEYYNLYLLKLYIFYHKCKNVYSWNPRTWICENSIYLKIMYMYVCYVDVCISNASVMTCDEVIYVIDIASTKVTNTIAKNVTKKLHNKKKILIFCIQFY